MYRLKRSIHRGLRQTLGLELVLLAMAAALAGGMFWLVSGRVTGPLHQIQSAMMRLAGGDFTVVLPGLDRKDEIGAMANAVERFKVLADQKARDEAEEATRRYQAETALQAEGRRNGRNRRKNKRSWRKSRPKPSGRSLSGSASFRAATSRSA